MVSNEVYTGAGASVTLIPEMDFDVGVGMNQASGNLDINDTNLNVVEWALSGANADKILVTNLYQGCMAKVTVFQSNNSTVRTAEQTLLIKSNDDKTITFNVDLTTTANNDDRARVVIQGFGAPLFRPSDTADKPYLLADNWLGLVQTIAPPTIDVENKQYNLAMGVTRDFGFQFKGREIIGNGSLDIAVNNGSWLYYVLGEQAITATTTSAEDLTSAKVDENELYLDTSTGNNTKFRRVIVGTGAAKTILPPLKSVDVATESEQVNATITNGVPIVDNDITYTFTPSNGAILPSFALELTKEKDGQLLTAGVDAKTNVDATISRQKIWSRIYTGCQVNSLTLSFEEGMELKSTVDFLSRRVFDAPTGYVPKANVPEPKNLLNYHSDQDYNQPFMFSDGAIRIYGQEYARVKSGTLTITNTLTPHTFIGNYDRSITSAHTAGQRMYELSLTMLITDSELWDKLREDNELQDAATASLIDLTFIKNSTEKIQLSFDNYLVTNVDVPFPEDKSAIEVTMTATARTLKTASYTGRWVIMG